MKRTQLFGLACLVGGLMWFATGVLTVMGVSALDTETGGVRGDLFFVLTNLCLMGGTVGLLAARATGTGWPRAIGIVGALITLLAQCSYIVGALGSIAIGQQDSELVLATRTGGALLVGLGMLLLGITTAAARRLGGWRRWAPLVVGLYYAVMLPIQIVFFISRGQNPSIALLVLWGLTWALLGYAIFTFSRQHQELESAQPALASKGARL